MRIKKGNSIGLIIDIQEKLYPHMHEPEVFLQKTKRLIEGLNILHIPIIVTEQYPKGLGATLPEIKQITEKAVYLEKMSFSCCDDKSFANQLRLSDKENVIIAGIESHVCVLQTVVDLTELGYQPIVVGDCVSSRKPSDKEIALYRYIKERCIITTCESILFELCRFAGTEEFKAISKIIK